MQAIRSSIVSLQYQVPTHIYSAQLYVILISKVTLWSKIVTEYQYYICILGSKKEEKKTMGMSLSCKQFSSNKYQTMFLYTKFTGKHLDINSYQVSRNLDTGS